MIFWACETCGETWEETGDQKGFGRAMAHRTNMRRKGEEHTIIGLIDRESGEILVDGLNIGDAMSRGYVQRKGKADPTGEPAAPVDEAGTPPPPPKKGGTPRTDPLLPTGSGAKAPGMWATVKGLTIEIPAHVLTYASMGMRTFLDPDTGAAYPWTADGIAKYLTDFLTLGHERLLYMLIGLSWEDYQRAEGQRLVASTIKTIRGLTNEAIAEMVQHHAQQEEVI